MAFRNNVIIYRTNFGYNGEGGIIQLALEEP